MPCLPCKQGEGHGLLCLRGQAEVVAEAQLAAERFEAFAKHLDERGIFSAAAGEDVVDAGRAGSG